jgi:hypothetical protein
MAVRLSPGVYISERDLTNGATLVGTGGVGIVAKLNKGHIGKPIYINTEKELINKGGMPIPGFNLVSWHSIDNILLYQASVVASRAENLEYYAKHNTSNQIFKIPVNSAQVGLALTGNTVPFNFKDEFDGMIKNRTIFKTVNVNDEFDVMNEDNGVDISDLDNSILIKNDDELDVMNSTNAFNTKSKPIYKLPKVGPLSIIKDQFVPELEVGQVYNSNGKLIEIGNNIYDNYFILRVNVGEKLTGIGTIVRDHNDANDKTLIGTGTSFTNHLKNGSELTLSYLGTPNSVTSNLSRTNENYSKIKGRFVAMVTGGNSSYAATGAENSLIVANGISRYVSYIEPSYSTTVTTTIDVDDTMIITDGVTTKTFVFKSTSSTGLEVAIGGLTTNNAKLLALKAAIDADADLKLTLTVTVEDTKIYVGAKKSYIVSWVGGTFTTFGGSVDSTPVVWNEYTSGTEVGFVYLTTTAPTSWATITSWTYSLPQTPVVVLVDKVMSDTILKVQTAVTSIPADNDANKIVATYQYNYASDLKQSTIETIYRDNTDSTGKTIIGKNVNFYTLLRIGSKIVVTLGVGESYIAYVASIVNKTKLILSTALINNVGGFVLSDSSSLAIGFSYSNFCFTASDINVGTTVYTSNGSTGVVTASDELNTDLSTPEFNYIVKLTNGSFNNGDKICISQLKSDEWPFYTNYINSITDYIRENNIVSLIYSMDTDSDSFTPEIGDIVYMGLLNGVISTAYKGYGEVLFVTPGGIGETTDTQKILTIELKSNDTTKTNNSYDTTGITSKIGKNIDTAQWYVALDGQSGNFSAATCGKIDFINMYDDVLVYETVENNDVMLMVNQGDVAGQFVLTDTIEDRYTYTYFTGSTPSASDKIVHSSTRIDGGTAVATEFMRVFAITPGAWANDAKISIAMCDMDNYSTALMEDNGVAFKALFEFMPDTTDKTLIAIAVMLDDLVVEKYLVSTDPKSKDENNISRYILDIINKRSSYVRIMLNTGIFSPSVPNGYAIHFNPIQNTKIENGFSGVKYELNYNYYYDVDGSSIYLTTTQGIVEADDVLTALEVFRNRDDVLISYTVDGEWSGNSTIANRMTTLCEYRNDSVNIIGPSLGHIVGIKDQEIIAKNLTDYVNDNGLANGSRTAQFSAFYGNVKQVYDVFNDTNVWLPISVDAVGINARIDQINDIWAAPAGMTRGNIQNFTKLGWNPNQEIRDVLYPQRVNPIVQFRGDGTVIWGVRSLCTRKSDLADIYNRKTLNYIERNLERSVKQFMFEFNDEQTRGQVVATIEPFLRGIRARRGLVDYQIVCDNSNNPASVVEQNTLVCDIYLKLQHVIETIELNFVITKTGASFSEA